MWEHPSSLEKISALLETLPVGRSRILDVGCGDGRLASGLVSVGHAVTGLDSNEIAVAAARERGLDARVADLETAWPVDGSSFDLVLMLDVLEHLVDPAKALAEASRVLAPEGHAIVVFPNHFDLRQRLETLFGRGIVHWSHRKYPDASPERYAHLRFLRLADLERMFTATGFRPIARQFNFMGGGVLPRRLLPKFVRSFLASRLPDLFSGKFGFLLTKDGGASEAKTIALAETP